MGGLMGGNVHRPTATVDGEPIGGGGGAAATWTDIDLTAATKVDPHGIEVSAPAVQGDSYYQIGVAASATRTATSDMLAYVIELDDVTHEDAFSIDLLIAAKGESAVKLVEAVFISDVASGFSAGAGVWAGLSEETSDSPDSWIRSLATNVPAVGGFASDDAVGIAHIVLAPGHARAGLRTFDLTGGDPTWKQDISELNYTPPSSGPVYIGVLIGVRGTSTASETTQVRAMYRVTEFPGDM